MTGWDWLFDSSAFMTRDHCGQWLSSLKAVYIGSSVTIAVSYFAISVSLLFMHKLRRGDIIARSMLLMFAAFIAMCGMTHLTDMGAFYWPAYRFYTFVFLLTAILSAPVAVTLPFAVIKALDRPTMGEYQALTRDLEATVETNRHLIDGQKTTIRELGHAVRNLEQVRALGEWSATQQKILDRMYSTVSRVEDTLGQSVKKRE